MKTKKIFVLLIIAMLLVSLSSISVNADEGELVTIRVMAGENGDTSDYNTMITILGDAVQNINPQEHNMGWDIIANKDKVNAITSIDLSELNLSKYSYLKNFPNLLELNLSNKGLTEVPDLSELESLKSLNLSNNNLTDISPLASLTQLTGLDLSNNNISDISSITNLTKLLGLHIDNNNISDLSAIKNMIALIDFSASNNNISDLSPLSDFASLRSLFLSSNLISDISLIKDISVRSLDLSNNKISDISEVTFTKYETANFSNNNIIDGWKKLDLGNLVSAKQQTGNIETSELIVTLPDIFSRANLDHAIIETDNGEFSSDFSTLTFDGTKDEVTATINITGGMGTFDKSVITVHYKKATSTQPTTENNNKNNNTSTTENVNESNEKKSEDDTTIENNVPKVTLENVTTQETKNTEDNSTAKGRMPYTGVTRSITMAGLIVALIVLSIHTYYHNKKAE